MSFFIRILLLIALFIAFMMSTGCSSLKFKNIAKTGATTAVTYAIAGPIPAIANLATSVTVDEILPEEPKLDQIETKEQSAAYIADSLFMNSLYAFIAFLLITNIAVPYVTRRWGYNEAKNKYRIMKETK
jgi:hypothetical protein